MKKEVLDFVVEKTKELIDAPTCSQEAREAAKAWLDAVGTDKEQEETKKYIAELEEDIVTVDGLIAFAESEAGALPGLRGGRGHSVKERRDAAVRGYDLQSIRRLTFFASNFNFRIKKFNINFRFEVNRYN